MRLARVVILAVLLSFPYGCGGSSGSDSSSSGGSAGGGGGTGEGGGTPGSSYPAAAEDCVETINQYRASIGLAAYVRWTDAEACADDEARRDAEANQLLLGHKTPLMTQRYAHHYPESLREGVEALGRVDEKSITNLAQSPQDQ
jgi:hypothetical protein